MSRHVSSLRNQPPPAQARTKIESAVRKLVELPYLFLGLTRVGVVALDVPDRVKGRDVETAIEEVRALRMESGRERRAAEKERKAAEEERKVATEARKAIEESRAKAARWW
ncbi:hypothetical protein DCAR_0728838 [Daucus carota subsp. sativus]|uniref:Uncharacterized protein n=1 Tax=Daucus carota subsp. sativus TaxID=79200 RepID=A0A164TVU6_DAUCS|nr:hypothetical protein DCAR_0728838 [Daucus carota subsp. sativus]